MPDPSYPHSHRFTHCDPDKHIDPDFATHVLTHEGDEPISHTHDYPYGYHYGPGYLDADAIKYVARQPNPEPDARVRTLTNLLRIFAPPDPAADAYHLAIRLASACVPDPAGNSNDVEFVK